MVYCWNCGTEIGDKANYCRDCGSRITKPEEKHGSNEAAEEFWSIIEA